MTKYVAMLRGVGPGNPNITKEKFKAFFEELGFKEVLVILGSGNIIFESSSTDVNKLAIKIEAALPIKLGFKRSVFIKSEYQLQSLVNFDPFKGIEQNHNNDLYLLITFFRQPQTIPFKLPYQPDNKPYVLLGKFDNCVYGSVDLKSAKTPDYMAWLEKLFGKEITSRTPKTIRRILSKMNGI